MTVPPDDPPRIWLKQVPKSDPNAPGVWTQELLPDHFTVQRSRTGPGEQDSPSKNGG